MPEWPYIAEGNVLPQYVPDPNAEPLRVAAGDSIKFTRTIPAYKASQGWSLKYSMRGVVGSAIDFTSTASGDDHLVQVDAGTTSGWPPGKYFTQGRAIGPGGETHLIFYGEIQVFPDLAIQPKEFDGRSHARICLDAIEAVLQQRATDDILGIKIEGTEIGRLSVPQLLLFRDRYKQEVKSQEEQARNMAGKATGRNILVRFSPVR